MTELGALSDKIDDLSKSLYQIREENAKRSGRYESLEQRIEELCVSIGDLGCDKHKDQMDKLRAQHILDIGTLEQALKLASQKAEMVSDKQDERLKKIDMWWFLVVSTLVNFVLGLLLNGVIP